MAWHTQHGVYLQDWLIKHSAMRVKIELLNLESICVIWIIIIIIINGQYVSCQLHVCFFSGEYQTDLELSTCHFKHQKKCETTEGCTFWDVLNTDFCRVTLMDEQHETCILDRTLSLPSFGPACVSQLERGSLSWIIQTGGRSEAHRSGHVWWDVTTCTFSMYYSDGRKIKSLQLVISPPMCRCYIKELSCFCVSVGVRWTLAVCDDFSRGPCIWMVTLNMSRRNDKQVLL